MWNLYEKDGRIIEATDLAYRVIYAAQGYKPKAESAKEAESDDEGGSDAGSRGKSQAARRRKSS
jgi:hypothetical protein